MGRFWVIQLALGVTFAGHDSTTGHLSWAVADLLQHPVELAKVRAEQRGHLRPGEQLDLATIHRMATLDRALRETAGCQGGRRSVIMGRETLGRFLRLVFSELPLLSRI